MANPYTSQSAGFGQFINPEQQAIERQRQMAMMLRQQSIQPDEVNQVVAGRVVPYSVTQGLAKLLQGYSGRKGLEEADARQADLYQKQAQNRAQGLEEFQKLYQGTPETQVQSMAPTVGNTPQNPQMVTQPAVPANPQAAYAALLRSGDPMLASMGMQGMASIPVMEARKQEREEQRGFQREQLQAQLQARKEAQEAQANLQRELRNMTNANRPEKMMTVLGPNGEPVTMPQSQAAGMTPYNPTMAKQLKAQAEQGQAKQQLSDAVGELRSYYDTLKGQGGIVSQDQGVLGNIGARLGSSPIGQTIGGAIGTKSQEARQKIEQTRPLLLNLIKNATGMSAQQMNSNAEMQLYLRAATDPTLSYEANQQALNNLDKMFGLGLGQGNSAAKPAMGAKPRRFNPATGQLEPM